MRDQWRFWASGIDSEVCDRIIKECLEIAPQEATVFSSGVKVDDSIRKSTVRWVAKNTWIESLIMQYVTLANRYFNIDIVEPFDIQFTEYREDQNGYYNWHHDIDWANEKMYDRKLSVVVQLTDPEEYDGGEFKFKSISQPEGFGKKGSVLIFPSYLEHCVTPVTKGTRHSLVTWIEGPRWR